MKRSSSFDKTVTLWDASNGSLVSRLSGHEGSVDAIAFSPDGSQLASGGDGNTIGVWDLRDPKKPEPVLVLTGHAAKITHLAYSPSGRRLASASHDGVIKVWDTMFFLEVLSLTGHRIRADLVTFSRDERTLYTGGAIPRFRVWQSK